jgi:Mg2+-importing ATPase
VIFAIRTRRIPFFRSHPSLPLALAAGAVVIVGAVLPVSPLAHALGFSPLPATFFAALGGLVICYLALIEAGKRIFYRGVALTPPTRRRYTGRRALRRRAAHFSARHRIPGVFSARQPPRTP